MYFTFKKSTKYLNKLKRKAIKVLSFCSYPVVLCFLMDIMIEAIKSEWKTEHFLENACLSYLSKNVKSIEMITSSMNFVTLL